LTMAGDTVVVRGVATDENERAVIGQLIALQPGVGDVQNEMTVGTRSNGPVVPPLPGS
jgi:hypothetical protein